MFCSTTNDHLGACIACLLCACALTLLADGAAVARNTDRESQLQEDSAAILSPIEDAGGYAAIADRLAPWRSAVSARIAAIPKRDYIAGDGPIDGGNGWLLSGRRARQLVYESDYTDTSGDARYAKTEQALLRTDLELKSLGIRLIVVPAPDKCDIYPELIAPVPEHVPTVHLKSKQLYLRLLHAGVEVLDSERLLLEHKGKESSPLYMRRDTHWGPAAIRLVASAVAERLPGLQKESSDLIERTGQVHSWDGDLAANCKRAGGAAFGKEVHRTIGVARADGAPVGEDKDAPVLLLGDSYSAYPYNGYFAFWAFLSQRLGFEVAHIDRAGGGNAVLERLRNMPPARRDNIRVVVLLFTNCAIYENDFQQISLLDAPMAPEPLRNARVTLLADAPAINPRTVDYADAMAAIPATVDRGDAFPIPVSLSTPVLRKRSLLPAAGWRKGDIHILDLYVSPPDDRPGTMVIDVGTDPASPVMYSSGKTKSSQKSSHRNSHSRPDA